MSAWLAEDSCPSFISRFPASGNRDHARNRDDRHPHPQDSSEYDVVSKRDSLLHVEFGSSLRNWVPVPRSPRSDFVASEYGRGGAQAGGDEQLYPEPKCEPSIHETFYTA